MEKISLTEFYKKELILASKREIRPRGSSVNSMIKALDIHAGKVEYFPLDLMDKTYLLSDIHFGHENVLKYSERPFETLEDMHETIMNNVAEVATQGNHLIVLGDCAMSKGITLSNDFFRLLPCKTYLVIGNHDLAGAGILRVEGFDVVTPIMVMEGKPNLFLTHYPIYCVEMPDTINVHGHEHQYPAHTNKHINVSVDQIGFKPVKLRDIYSLAAREHAKPRVKQPQRMTHERLSEVR